MKKKWAVLLCFVLFFSQCKKKSQGEDPVPAADPAVASATRVILTIGSVNWTNRDLKNFIQLQYADIFEKKNNDKLLSRLFDVFCEQQSVLFKANQDGVEVDDGEVETFLGEVRARGQAPALDREMVRNTLKVQKYLLAGPYRDIDVSDAEVAAYYESHLGDYQKTEEIELHQIMVKDREKLLQIRSELLRQPARFEEIARSESISPEADKGGAMGLFEQGMLPREMEEVVFSLKVNEISPIVESPYGFHLFKVTRKRKSRMQLLAAVKDEIRSKLLSAKLTAAYAGFLGGLAAEVPVQARYENLYFTYIKPEPGVDENESKNLPGSDPLSDG
ncbi:MAG: peptidyl-prolyl cis-trans isomerase [Acidobacteria bacterium]|jgi:parvulin-like peptidyl-prolyl isomerase|nr:peptidyl-prolyl cis-trans isomerase [Acidobacteriota bacterium]